MCGITGFFSSNHNFSESDLRSMTQMLYHRGPNADGYFFDGVCGLGHRRLSILDLSEQANQPMHSSNFTIVFNGEVYNFHEIAKDLQLKLRTSSDTEVILEAFIKKGIDFVHELNGMFALAIYDKRKQELYLLRDRIGIKPLYYFWDGNKFAFASELKSLSQLNQEINPAAIHDFLHLGYIPAPKSIYKNIFKLPAGSWLKISKHGLEIKKYWNLQDKISQNILTDEIEAKEQLHNLLQSSIKYRLISDVPLGIFLSGGIDSSLVAALATNQSDNKVNTFSIGFKESQFNESEFAKKVANHLDTNHHEFMISTTEAKQLIPKLVDIYDEPFADSSAIPTMLVSKLAKEHVTVVLGGDGGDELFFGYNMYQWAQRLSNPFLKTFRQPISNILKLLKANKYQKASELFNYPDEQNLANHIFSQEQSLFSNQELTKLLTNPCIEPQNIITDSNRILTAMEKQALFDLEYYLPDELLVKVDRATMQHSLEARVPLLDYRIIEFALNLSPKLKYRNGISKYLLKQILYKYIPKELFNRPKCGFSIPLVEWLQTDLKYLLDDYLNEKIINNFGIVKYEQVKQMKRQFLAGNSYVYGRLWALIILHQFLIKHDSYK
jgi:asparagine synthase (glutamine-hydrolysing)